MDSISLLPLKSQHVNTQPPLSPCCKASAVLCLSVRSSLRGLVVIFLVDQEGGRIDVFLFVVFAVGYGCGK